MNWFDKWFSNKCKQAWENSRCEVVRDIPISTKSIDSNNGIHFTIYRADGGHVIETRKYDRRKDENNHTLHVITDDKDLGEEISKIITFQQLRS